MAETHDTIDKLLAEFRGYSAGMPASYHVTMSWADFRRMLDRFDAAHRRERGDCAKLREALLQVIRSMELESEHICTEKKRLGMHGQTQEDLCKGCRARNDECWTMTLKRECEAALATPATAEKSSAVGDAAKLREAVAKCVNLITEFGNAEIVKTPLDVIVDIEAILNAALAAPPRNCDRPECATTKAAQEVWRKEDGGKTAYYEWLLAPAAEKEGGNK